ncbi:hypothetical protein Cabys_544 [Caldithrix abyssi DSM 13497]|uniref:Uncharacterized protein n=1 Tax=Caldithrix abyssi DSM 13497 TaxID=880073 RepID=A0A1J1C3R3_CALAY|nr:hypothetical protein Cabys_544 [Caldithrix abyssi DSM 13497]
MILMSKAASWRLRQSIFNMWRLHKQPFIMFWHLSASNNFRQPYIFPFVFCIDHLRFTVSPIGQVN